MNLILCCDSRSFDSAQDAQNLVSRPFDFAQGSPNLSIIIHSLTYVIFALRLRSGIYNKVWQQLLQSPLKQQCHPDLSGWHYIFLKYICLSEPF